jgi:N utilization substance protein B
MQALFTLALTDRSPDEVLAERLAEEPLPPRHADFARRLVTDTWAHRDEIDARIARAAPHWPLAQLATVERAILRLAIYELAFDNETPMRAAINEAVELAKVYGGEHSGRFVNGVLGYLASEGPKGGEC